MCSGTGTLPIKSPEENLHLWICFWDNTACYDLQTGCKLWRKTRVKSTTPTKEQFNCHILRWGKCWVAHIWARGQKFTFGHSTMVERCIKHSNGRTKRAGGSTNFKRLRERNNFATISLLMVLKLLLIFCMGRIFVKSYITELCINFWNLLKTSLSNILLNFWCEVENCVFSLLNIELYI